MLSGYTENLKKRMKNEAITALTAKPVKTYSAERIRLWSEICEEVDGLSCQPLRIGKSLELFLDRVSIPVSEDDILIGRMTEECFTDEEEAVFRKTFITEKMRFDGIPRFWFDGGHCSFSWEDIINLGLTGFKDKAEVLLKKARENGETEKANWLQGAVDEYRALLGFLLRCADEAGKKGLHDAAQACRKAASGAPDSFRTAMQLIYTIEFVFCAYISPNPTLTLGRPDLFLYDLYRADIESGRLTQEEAELIVCDYYAKNNLYMGRGEHQISGGSGSPMCTGWHRILAYDSPQYLILGGTDPKTKMSVGSELTELFVRCIEPEYKNPVIVFRYARDYAKDHETIWKTLVGKMRSSASILVYNDIPTCAMYINSGVPEEDAYSCEYYGCNWPTLPAMDQNVEYLFVHGGILRWVLDAFRIFADSGKAYSRDAMLSCIRDLFYKNACAEEKLDIPPEPAADSNALSYETCFLCGCVEHGGIYYKYKHRVISFGGIGTVIDCLSAVDYMITEKKCDLGHLLDVCAKDFEGEPVLLAQCKNAPKFGDGSDIPAFFAKHFTNTAIDAINKAVGEMPPYYHLCYCLELDTQHIGIGQELGATPDGRRKGMPISQNTQPYPGSSVNGLTAMLSSVANLPFEKFASGAFNVTVTPAHFAGDTGLVNLAKIIETYFENGGLQIQLSAVDRDLLIEAQKHPEEHRDLMVRVTGYSAVFVDMEKAAQDDIIARNTF